MALGFRFDAIKRALGIRNYRIYTSGNIVAHFGVWAYRIGLLSLTWELTQSAFWLGAMAMADLCPTVVLSPLAGALTERVNRMAMMRFTVIFTGLQSSVLALLCLNGNASIAIVFPLALVLGIVLAINHPMRLVIVTNLVGRDEVPSALAINSLVFNVARVAGPSIAGGIIAGAGSDAALLGTAIVFGVCAVGHLVFAIALFMVRMTSLAIPHKPRPLSHVPGEIMEGFRYAAAHPGIGPLLFILFVVGLTARGYADLFAGYVDAVFGLGTDAFGLMLSSVGLGAVLGGLWLAQRGHIAGLTRIFLAYILVLACALILFSVTDNFYLALVWVFIAGFAQTVAGTGEHVLIQAAVDEHLRGRVVSLYGAVSRGTPALGALAMGWLGDEIGLRWPIAGGAVICTGLWAWAFSKRCQLAEALETPPGERGA
jgi:predicted MFS family arabinose efflux permease